MSITVGLNEFKKQASFFLREKIRTARLALTDVTPAQLLTEEAINGNCSAPDAKTMGFISRSAFEIDDYWRIVEILHRSLSKFERKQWRDSYNALVLLEHLLTHGPESIAEEFHGDREIIGEMNTFQFVDEKGFNWGLKVKAKAEHVLELLEKGPLFREERDRARKISRGIQGFGSFNQSFSNNSSNIQKDSNSYGRSNSNYENYSGKENQNFDLKAEADFEKRVESREEERFVLKEREFEPFLPRDEGKRANEIQKLDHPFGFEKQRRESLLLLSQG